jgi:hypothetical protein
MYFGKLGSNGILQRCCLGLVVNLTAYLVIYQFVAFR